MSGMKGQTVGEGKEMYTLKELAEMFYTVEEIARLTKSSRAKWRKKISRKEIPIVRIGRHVRIPQSYVSKMLADGYEEAVSITTTDNGV